MSIEECAAEVTRLKTALLASSTCILSLLVALLGSSRRSKK